MAPVMYLIVFASSLLIVVNGQDNVSEQLREIKETLRQRDALYEQQHNYIAGRDALYEQQENYISGIAEDLRTLSGTMERYLATQDDVMTQLAEVKEFLRLVHPLPRSCADIQSHCKTQSGVYTVYVRHTDKPLQVYCDMETDGGGWLVFQRRQDGLEDFYRNWTQYESGFGYLSTEFWLGNQYLHSLTSGGNQQIRVDMEDFDGDKRYAEYDSFSVGSPADKYVLTIGTYHGTAGDSLTAVHNGRQFTTHDQDNDRSSSRNCARSFHGGWWYSNCHYTNPNGRYIHVNTGESENQDMIIWRTFRGKYYSMKHIEMKMRPSDA